MPKTLDDLNEWAVALRKEGHPLAETMEEIAEGWREDTGYLKRRTGMKLFDSGKFISEKNSFVWERWWRLLVSESDRSLFSINLASAPSPKHYGVLADISKQGLNIILSFRHKTLSIGVGLVE